MDTTHDTPPPTSLLSDVIQKDSDIWFEDGNVIVIAQHTAFRFHKGVLSRHSQVFRDLFLVPQPSTSEASASDVFDGCPAVRVSDTSYDFRELLRAIYGGVRYVAFHLSSTPVQPILRSSSADFAFSYLHPDRSATFPVLAALGRLAHKYQLHELLEAVVHRLKGTFTTQIEVWDRSGGFNTMQSPLKLGDAHAIEAINLFRLLDKPEMIPIALYGCCQLWPKALVRGVRREDGVSLERLSPDDMELCLGAKQTLVRQTVRLLSHLGRALETRISDAENDGLCPIGCVVELKTLLDEWGKWPHEYMDEDPLNDYCATRLDEAEDEEGLCSACADAVRERLSELRNEIWTKLPGLLGLDQIAGWNSDT